MVVSRYCWTWHGKHNKWGSRRPGCKNVWNFAASVRVRGCLCPYNSWRQLQLWKYQVTTPPFRLWKSPFPPLKSLICELERHLYQHKGSNMWWHSFRSRNFSLKVHLLFGYNVRLFECLTKMRRDYNSRVRLLQNREQNHRWQWAKETTTPGQIAATYMPSEWLHSQGTELQGELHWGQVLWLSSKVHEY